MGNALQCQEVFGETINEDTPAPGITDGHALRVVLMLLEAKRTDRLAQPQHHVWRTHCWRLFIEAVWSMLEGLQMGDCDRRYLWRGACWVLPCDLHNPLRAHAWQRYKSRNGDRPIHWLSHANEADLLDRLVSRNEQQWLTRSMPDPETEFDDRDLLSDTLPMPSGRINVMNGEPQPLPVNDPLESIQEGISTLLHAKHTEEWFRDDRMDRWDPDWNGNRNEAYVEMEHRWQMFADVAWSIVSASPSLADAERHWIWRTVRRFLPSIGGRPLYPLRFAGANTFTPPLWAQTLEMSGSYKVIGFDRCVYCGHPAATLPRPVVRRQPGPSCMTTYIREE